MINDKLYYFPTSELDPKLHDEELHKSINIGFSPASSGNPSEIKRKQRQTMIDLRKNKNLQKLMQSSKCKQLLSLNTITLIIDVL